MAATSKRWTDSLQFSSLFWPPPQDLEQRKAHIIAYVVTKDNRNTAKTFYAASIFFEILNQFGDVQPDLEQKQKYAAWKAADIRKAIKEGRKPVPGPPGGDKDNDLSDTSSSGYDLEPSRNERQLTSGPPPESHPPPQFYEKSDQPPPPPLPPSSNIQTESHLPPQFYEKSDQPSPPSSNIQKLPPSNYQQPSSTVSPPPPAYSSNDYPSNNFHQTYHNQPSYPQEPQHHNFQNYPSQDPSFSYPNFRSYPSFSETTLPAAPPHYPSSHYHGSEQSPYSSSAARPADYSYTGQYMSNAVNGSGPSLSQEPAPAPAPTPVVPAAQAYQYDSNYQPAPEKIAEAHKAARFAVGALAFDDVFVAVDYLKKSLELLTNPSASV